MNTVKIAIAALTLCLFCGIAAAQTAASGGYFTDKRDGRKYRTVKIGKMVWMAENLNFKTGESWCYDNADSNCTKYGRLYDWNTAIKACPAGWRLPDTTDWNNLISIAGGQSMKNEDWGHYWSMAGGKLKSKTGWDICYDESLYDDGKAVNCDGNGTNDFGFSALPGGHHNPSGYAYAGNCGYWWSAAKGGDDDAWGHVMDDQGNVFRNNGLNNGFNTILFSVRCVQK